MSTHRNSIYLFTVLVIISRCNSSSTCKGCVDLDEFTFDKLVKRFEVTVVKFDIAYPYGEQHEAYTRFAEDVHPIDGLLAAVVGIKDYGDMDNKNLSKRFDVPDQLPIIKLFLNGDITKWFDYSPKEVRTEDLKQFVRKHSGIYIGLAGCLQEFDEIANEFVRNLNTEAYEVAVAKGNQLMNGYDTEKMKNTGKVYIKLMKRVLEVGLDYIEEERLRTMEMLGKKISQVKKQEMLDRLNILKAFEMPEKLLKTEL